jgi:hypothetical protein
VKEKSYTCVLAILVFSGFGLAQTTAKEKPTPTPKEKPYTCVAGPHEICASDLWYADYLRLEALTKKYAAPQDVQDMMNGMTLRLQQQIPQGYHWDSQKKRFVESQAAPTVTTKPANPEYKPPLPQPPQPDAKKQ